MDAVDFDNNPTVKLFADNGKEKDTLLPFEAFTTVTERNISSILNNNISFTADITTILNDSCFNSSNCGRESLGILNLTYANPDCEGRESLGILNLNPFELNIEPNAFHNNVSKVSFNSCSLNGSDISRIYSVGSSCDLNNAFIGPNSAYSIYNSNKFLSPFNLCPAGGDHQKLRIKSLPASIIRETPILDDIKEIVDEQNVIDGAKSKSCIESEMQPIEDEFNDSVFIEAHHIASKIADGSILNESSEEINILDCTPQPDFNDIEEDLVEIKKCDTETIFRTVDKMLPPIMKPTIPLHSSFNEKIDCSGISNNSGVQNASGGENQTNVSGGSQIGIMSKSEFYHKLSTSHLSHNSSSGSKSKAEIMQNLSTILSNDNLNSRQVNDAQNLLLSLASIISDYSGNSSRIKSDSLEDSGHSSIEVDQNESPDANLACKAIPTQDIPKALDLSLKYKTESTQAQSTRINENTLSNLHESNNRRKEADHIKNSVDSRKPSAANKTCGPKAVLKKDNMDNVGKLKPKKMDGKAFTSKKGPLKAIPIGNWSKASSIGNLDLLTPTETSKTQSLFKFKKTSTPYNEPKIKPVAQSTPEAIRTKSAIINAASTSRKFECPSSPVSRISRYGNNSALNDSTKSGSDISGSLPNISNTSGGIKKLPTNTFSRRRSASDLKPNKNIVPLKRSYSIGKEASVSAAAVRAREFAAKKNLNLKQFNTSKSSESQENLNRSGLSERNRSFKSTVKPYNLASRLKSGKENAGS